ncbi:grpE protein homolog 1, mitochondrial isoform X2 [Anabrus simplex]|uniref:grpE protein homolog 1, mitochondrial isoform X2 n=1 Tax=Anabrus simplex TaxID=316456 RepID=UPI0035A2A007
MFHHLQTWHQWAPQITSVSNWQCSQKGLSTAAPGESATGAQQPSEADFNLKSEFEKLTAEVAALAEKNQELEAVLTTEPCGQIRDLVSDNQAILDKYKRALAEGENMRRRLTKQIEDAKLFGIQGFCKDLLEVADILAKATESVPKEEIQDSNPHLKNLYEGLIMTEAQLKKVFQRHGLVPVNPIDEKFNPNLHEALFQQEVEGKEPGTVVVVSKVGYKLHERVIRPALVGVAKGS